MRSAERRGLVLAFFVFGLFWGAWSAVLPALRQQAHLSDGQLGLALGAIAISAVPMMPVAGYLADRFGARIALPTAILAFGLVVPLPALTHSLGALVPPLVLVGLATGALEVFANTTAATWERVEGDRLMSTVHGAFSVGVLVGGASAGLARQAGARPFGVLLAAAVVIVAVGLTQPRYRAVEREAVLDDHARLPLVMLGIGVLTAAAFLCEDAVQSWSSLHLERGLGASPAVSGLGPALFAGAMAVGRLGGGLVGVGERVQLAVAGSLLTAGVLVVALAPSAGVALAGLVVAGAGTSVLAPVLYSAVGARAAPGRQGAALSKVTALGYVGFVAGPPLVGIVSAASSLPVALGALALLSTGIAVGGPLVLAKPGARL
jgi:MFS family permease